MLWQRFPKLLWHVVTCCKFCMVLYCQFKPPRSTTKDTAPVHRVMLSRSSCITNADSWEDTDITRCAKFERSRNHRVNLCDHAATCCNAAPFWAPFPHGKRLSSFSSKRFLEFLDLLCPFFSKLVYLSDCILKGLATISTERFLAFWACHSASFRAFRPIRTASVGAFITSPSSPRCPALKQKNILKLSNFRIWITSGDFTPGSHETSWNIMKLWSQERFGEQVGWVICQIDVRMLTCCWHVADKCTWTVFFCTFSQIEVIPTISYFHRAQHGSAWLSSASVEHLRKVVSYGFVHCSLWSYPKSHGHRLVGLTDFDWSQCLRITWITRIANMDASRRVKHQVDLLPRRIPDLQGFPASPIWQWLLTFDRNLTCIEHWPSDVLTFSWSGPALGSRFPAKPSLGLSASGQGALRTSGAGASRPSLWSSSSFQRTKVGALKSQTRNWTCHVSAYTHISYTYVYIYPSTYVHRRIDCVYMCI